MQQHPVLGLVSTCISLLQLPSLSRGWLSCTVAHLLGSVTAQHPQL